MATWSYEVRYIYDDSNGSGPNKDLTPYVISIENMTDTGSGEVNTATLTLNAKGGDFITRDPVGGLTAPYIDQFDKIKITLTDKNEDVYSRVFEVDTVFTKKTMNEGIRVIINLIGMERQLMNIFFAKQYYFESAYAVSKDIIDKYASNKGSRQPYFAGYNSTATGDNELPQWTANTYDFGVTETPCYDGLMEVINKLGTSVSAGGAQNFFELTFTDDGTALGLGMDFHAFVSGSKPTSEGDITTITNATTTPIYNTQGTNEALTGNVIVGKGAQGYGSLPKEQSEWWASLEFWQAIKEWEVTTGGYPTDARVKRTATDGEVTKYKANTQTTAGSFVGGEWDEIYPRDVIGSLKYSPWTNEGYTNNWYLWKNSGSNANSTTHDDDFETPGCWDSNLSIRDEDHFRTWADCKATSPAGIPTDLLFDGTDVYRGFRVLVNGTGSGDFTDFDNNIMRYEGSNWVSIKQPDNDAQCAVIDEGKCYNYSTSTSTWTATITELLGTYYLGKNDCFHSWKLMGVDQGVANTLRDETFLTYGDYSAISYKYEWQSLITGFNNSSEGYYNIGAWANFRIPFPISSYNSMDLGDLYGGNSGTNFEPTTLDINNMHLTPSGKSGFNENDSEELGIITALGFTIKLNWTDNLDITHQFEADFKMRCTCYDTSGNCVVQDFSIGFNNNWEQIELPINKFQIYRSRAAWGWGDIASNLILPGLEILEIFEWKNLKQISIQTQDSYDDQGRYRPEFGRFGPIRLTPATERIYLYIDNFHFLKQLMAISGQNTTRAIMPEVMQRPFTTNYLQLKNDVLSQKEIEQFRYNAYDIETEGICDPNLKMGYSFYLEDDKLVSESQKPDNGGTVDNTIKLVTKKITYNVNGTTGGSGGFTRKILGVERI